ncbi:unnamed protein product, partial [Rotaria magnacalcarata]
VKLPKSFPFYRQYQRTSSSSKFFQSSSTTTTHSKLIKQPKTTVDSSTFVTVSILTIPSTIGNISTVDDNHGHNASSSSILTVV